MPYFHATAVFEARGSSLEETDRSAAALFKTLRHQRVSYYEHDTGGGMGPYPPAKDLYFSVIADFDVEANSEEKAGELAEEVLDALSTDEIQYLALGLTAGEQRVRPEQRAPREEEPAPERETRAERGEREERGGRGRGSRGRGRRRGGDRETESPRENKPQELVTRPLETEPTETRQAEPAETSAQAETPTQEALVEASPAAKPAIVERELLPSAPDTIELETPPPPPPRSSSAMRVTLSVTLRASELALPTNGSAVADEQELIALATAEARRRHPELPADITPAHEVVSQPWGDTVLTLTWHYDVPVPSATEPA
ncbi:MAG: hypothetical protein HYZ72_02620 [Deltaproteobacteria bacterium]|nr:hypothetical protein [Deltaproteobacteria bacterium]